MHDTMAAAMPAYPIPTTVAARTWLVICLLGWLPMPPSANGQSDVDLELEGPEAIEFSFSNPGARSMGFGGAFVARADDATAAFANPAGLVQLAEPELSAEGRLWSYDTPYTEGGRISGQPSGRGLDTATGLRLAKSSRDLTDLSFFSYVHPWKRWSFAFYRHQLANFESLRQTQGLFAGGSDVDSTQRLADNRLYTRLDIVGYGIAGAFRVSDALSIGLGISQYEGSFDLFGEIFAPDDASVESRFGANSYLPERLIANASVAANHQDSAVHAGFLWSASQRWNVGGVFREGPDVDLVLDFHAGPAIAALFPPGTLIQTQSASLTIPDVFGLGVSYRTPSGDLTLGFEWDHVGYSELDSRIRDGDEIHLGAEYVFLESRPLIALRLGAWLDPDHRFPSESDNPLRQGLFPPGDDEIHLAMGVGLVLERLKIDLAADFSDLVDSISVSTIFSF